MQKILKLGNITRIHMFEPSEQEINKLSKKYDLHELIKEDLIRV
ncbi:MAG: hypothetical protein WC872_03075 [Candidatus Absconditabacterales bacterium]